MVSSAFLVGILTIFLYLLWRRYINRILDGLKPLNGPTAYPFIGNLAVAFPASTIMQRMGDTCDIFGKNYKVSMPWMAGMISADADFAEEVLTSQATINKNILYTYLSDWLGDGLLLSSSAKWHSRRKMITPAFHFKILDQFVQVFNKNNSILVQQLEKSVKNNGSRVNITKYVTLAAMDNIVETAMGTCMNSQLNDQSEYVRATKFMTQNIVNRMISPMANVKPLYMLTPAYWKERKAMEIVKGYTMSLIRKKREALNHETSNGSTLKTTIAEENEDETFGIKKKTAFLDLLLQATDNGKPLSDQDIMEEVDTFMFEGHDTVSAGISFALFCIAQHPDIQAKIIDEQRAIFGDDPSRDVTNEDLKEMYYLEMVIKEAQRLFPSVPIIGRSVTEDFKHKDLIVRKGCIIILCLHKIHKDPEHYPNPDAFIPERFLPEEQRKRHPFAYLPFSAGHRNCIGQKFAMMELKSTISKVCRHFVLGMTNPPHECDIQSAVVLFSSNGVNIDLKRREW